MLGNTRNNLADSLPGLSLPQPGWHKRLCRVLKFLPNKRPKEQTYSEHGKRIVLFLSHCK